MKRTLIPLFAAAFLFACGTPAENATDSAKEGTHTEGDGHEHAAEGHDEHEGHSHDDGHAHAFARHQMSAKTRKQKRKLRHSTIVAAVDTPGVKRLLPYL